MCGIASYRSPGAEKLVEKMLAAQKHRGPDASGIYHDGRVRITTPAGEEVLEAPVTGDVALGHNLLSIIGGPQPVTGRGVLVFNGEIYNHRELHGEGSDAEVLLKLIEEQEGDMEEVLRSTVNTIDGTTPSPTMTVKTLHWYATLWVLSHSTIQERPLPPRRRPSGG